MASKKTEDPSLTPRKTPGQGRAVATVAAILEAAARILETEGLAAYTTNAVAALAGVSIGSLYQYFPSKDAITRALINREAEQLLEDVNSIEITNDPHAGLELLIRAAVKHQFRRPGLARLLDVEEIRLPMSEDYVRMGREIAKKFERCLAGTGMVARKDLATTSRDLASIVKALVDAAGQRGETNEPALVARVRKAVFGYILYSASQHEAGKR
ncbi:TetR/AcrR family transcriptional regulator [Undibacterium terreum]|uniref:TetR family transcriptional regulator n=1 Tax=Undibacterium terreum TaxID=1224302 RepID=A0A916UBL9_9BURK|nr:TetR/AcrR family transcriptional regulator [Undibacterium terreum]GGC66390.1 TetR family transcriptional regulator [Undibacterium terreum]